MGLCTVVGGDGTRARGGAHLHTKQGRHQALEVRGGAAAEREQEGVHSVHRGGLRDPPGPPRLPHPREHLLPAGGGAPEGSGGGGAPESRLCEPVTFARRPCRQESSPVEPRVELGCCHLGLIAGSTQCWNTLVVSTVPGSHVHTTQHIVLIRLRASQGLGVRASCCVSPCARF
eukprot:1195044-Prorocentrum_minimum.AAC.3